MPAKKKPKTPKSVKTLTHAEEKRENIPTAEYQSLVEKDPLMVAYARRNTSKRFTSYMFSADISSFAFQTS